MMDCEKKSTTLSDWFKSIYLLYVLHRAHEPWIMQIYIGCEIFLLAYAFDINIAIGNQMK